jgi:uncharacterized protein (TIGR02118 family)
MIILMRKKESMSGEEFADYLSRTHAPMASKMPGLRKYVVNVVQRPPGKEPDFHGVAELWFDDKETMKNAFASPEGRATQQDSEKFTSQRTTLFVGETAVL